jgi:hypothetical protein
MTGANYLTNRDATNRKPIEDDKWTDIHLPHCMLRSGASTQRKACPEVLVSLKRWISDVTGVDTPNSVRTQQWRRYIVTLRYVMQRTPSNTFSWNVATPRQTKDEDVWSKRCGKCWQRSVQAM